MANYIINRGTDTEKMVHASMFNVAAESPFTDFWDNGVVFRIRTDQLLSVEVDQSNAELLTSVTVEGDGTVVVVDVDGNRRTVGRLPSERAVWVADKLLKKADESVRVQVRKAQ